MKKALLLIDEATSALDHVNYQVVESILLSTKSTVVNITHKIHPEIAKQYDAILFLKDGKLAAKGTYEELILQEKDFQEFFIKKSSLIIL